MMNRHLIKYHSLSYTRFKHLELAVVYNNGAKALHIVNLSWNSSMYFSL